MNRALVDMVLWYVNFFFASGLCWWFTGHHMYYEHLVRSLNPEVTPGDTIDPSTLSLEDLQHYEKLLEKYNVRGPMLMLSYLATKQKQVLKAEAQKKIWQRELRRAEKHVKR